MSIFIQDTARNNLISWTTRAVKGNYAVGAMLSPFASPVERNGHKRSAVETSQKIREVGREFWLDPMSHALGMPRAGDFRFYDQWNFWSGKRGDLSTRTLLEDHVKRVLGSQVALDSMSLLPTTLVSYPDTLQSQKALELASFGVSQNRNAWVTVAGDQQFWASEAELDAHIGALDQLQPAGWLLIVTRGDNAMPPGATPEEVFGLMRTTFALSRDRPVRIAYGDIAALPAVAAGAEAIGTGWDMRQRICAYQDFEERTSNGDGGSWYQRPTLLGLLGSLVQGEYRVLQSEQESLSRSLSPGSIGSKPEQAFKHHAQVMKVVVDELRSLDGRDRIKALHERYMSAQSVWPRVKAITGTRLDQSNWIESYLTGLSLFMTSEGWN